ncbi:MAG: hypothetical protein SPL33_03165 [Fibrobacter sp.]|nr:hypothetical protein [Fibrobacter sp.]
MSTELLDEVTSAGSVTLPLLDEDDSIPGSSFSPAEADELSSHPTTANATKPIVTRNFFIKDSNKIHSLQM